MSSFVLSLPARQITGARRTDDGRVVVEFDHYVALYLDQTDLDRLAPFVTKEQ